MIPALVSIESQKLAHVLFPQASFEVLLLSCWKSSVSSSFLQFLIPALVSIESQKLVHVLLPQASFEVLLLPCWKSCVSSSSLQFQCFFVFLECPDPCAGFD